MPRYHSMSCEFPEGCSCGASEWNALEAENAKLREAARFAFNCIDGGCSASGKQICLSKLRGVLGIPEPL